MCVYVCVCLSSPPDLLRPLSLQRTLRQRADHLGQRAHPHPGFPGHERQRRMVAGRGGRSPRLCTIQLHPQVRIHLRGMHGVGGGGGVGEASTRAPINRESSGRASPRRPGVPQDYKQIARLPSGFRLDSFGPDDVTDVLPARLSLYYYFFNHWD